MKPAAGHFALFSEGRLVAMDETSAEEIAAIEACERVRRREIHEEERDARDMGFALLRSGGNRKRRRKALLLSNYAGR